MAISMGIIGAPSLKLAWSGLRTMPRWLLGSLVLSRFFLWIYLAPHPERCATADSGGYFVLAHNIMVHHAFSLAQEAPFVPDTTRTPLYPLFLVPFLAIAPSPAVLVMAAQSVLAILTGGLLWAWLFRATLSQRAASIGAGLFVFDWGTWSHSVILLADSIFVSMFLLAFISTWEAVEAPRDSSIKSGLLWGLTALVKPIVIYLPLFLGWAQTKTKKGLACFLLAGYLLPSLWVARNVAVAGFFGFSSLDGYALFVYPAVGIEAMRTHKPRTEVAREMEKDVEAALASIKEPGPLDYRRAYLARFRSEVREHPVLLAVYCFHGVIRILASTGLDTVIKFFHPQGIPTATNEGVLVNGMGTQLLLAGFPWLYPLQILYLCGLLFAYFAFTVGIGRLWTRGSRKRAALLVGTFLYFVAISSHQGTYRFRLPLIPLLAIGAAVAFAPVKPFPGRWAAD